MLNNDNNNNWVTAWKKLCTNLRKWYEFFLQSNKSLYMLSMYIITFICIWLLQYMNKPDPICTMIILIMLKWLHITLLSQFVALSNIMTYSSQFVGTWHPKLSNYVYNFIFILFFKYLFIHFTTIILHLYHNSA